MRSRVWYVSGYWSWITTYTMRHAVRNDPQRVTAICIENMPSARPTRLQRRWWWRRTGSNIFFIFVTSLSPVILMCLVNPLNSCDRASATTNINAEGANQAKAWKHPDTTLTNLIISARRSSVFEVINMRSCNGVPNKKYAFEAAKMIMTIHSTAVAM